MDMKMYANDCCNAAYTKAFLDVSNPEARKLLDTNIIGPIGLPSAAFRGRIQNF